MVQHETAAQLTDPTVQEVPLRRPPGPHGFPFVSILPYIVYDRLRFYLWITQRHGDIAMVAPKVYVINHPDYVKYVLQEHNINYIKGAIVGELKLLVGEGLLMSEGDFWRRQRRLAQPAFHRKHLGTLAEAMTAATTEMLERWQHYAAAETRFDVAEEMMGLTLTIVARTLFSADVKADIEVMHRELPVALRYITRRSTTLLNLSPDLPLPNNLRFKRAVAAINKIVYRIIEERRQSGEDKGDLLSMLIDARDEDTNERMNDKQLRDEVITIFLAGHETTANALAWGFYQLSKSPVVERQLYAEIDDVLGGRLPTVDDLPQLRYTKMVVDEILRLYPPAWMTARTAVADDEIGGYPIKAGTALLIAPYALHRHPQFWDNPEGFDPERFAPEQASNRSRFAYIPFSGGPRICIGNNFALMELQLVLATVLQQYRLNLVPGHAVVAQPMVTLRPRNGILMTTQRRS